MNKKIRNLWILLFINLLCIGHFYQSFNIDTSSLKFNEGISESLPSSPSISLDERKNKSISGFKLIPFDILTSILFCYEFAIVLIITYVELIFCFETNIYIPVGKNAPPFII